MPDTGAPWNIPYAQASDLVRDWPALSEDVAEAVADGLAIANLGIGSNIVQTVKLDTFSTTSTSLVDVTGMSVTITPSSETSKVLVVFMAHFSVSIGANSLVQLVRNSTAIFTSTGNRPSTASNNFGALSSPDAMTPLTVLYLDSPETTSATTYKIQTSVSTGTLYLNRDANNANSATSSFTAIEVAA